MAKKRRSKAQKAATRKMLAANRAKRAGKRKGARSFGPRKTPRKRKSRRAKSYMIQHKAKRKSGKRKSAKRVAAGKKAARTRKRHKAERKVARKTTRKSARRAGKRSKRKSGKRRSRRVRAAHSIKLPRGKRGAKKRVGIHVKVGKRRRSRGFSVPRKTKRVYVIAAEKRRKRRKSGGKKRKSSHRRRTSHRRSTARENPANGTELFIGLVTGLAGFLSADAVDRLLATHALTGTAAPYTDTPPTTGDYSGLFNATAICAPMNLPRWAAGIGMFALPLVGAHFVSPTEHPNLKAGLQFFGFAAGMRILGKATIDLVAQVAQSSMVGQQLYDGELRAAILAANAGSSTAPGLSNLPSSGLGRARLGAGNAKGCAPCATKKLGAGWPSAPRQVTAATTPATQTNPTAATTPAATTPAAATPPAPPSNTAQQGASGVRRGKFGGNIVRNTNWGFNDEAAE